MPDEEMMNRQMRRGDAIQRAAEGWSLRVQGRTWRQIADALGYSSQQAAHRAVMRFAGSIPDPEPNTLRDLWRARAEHLWSLAVRDAERGRAGALRAAVAVADRAAKLDGLDAPTRVSVGPDGEQLDAIVADLLRRAGVEEVRDAEVLELEWIEVDADEPEVHGWGAAGPVNQPPQPSS